MINLTKKYKMVVICGHEVKITYHKKLSNYGEFYGEDNRIKILNDDRWKHHLLHEVLHAVLYYSGHAFKFKENEEEAIVRAMESGLTSLTFF